MSEQASREIAEIVAELPHRQFLVTLDDGAQLTACFSRVLVGRRRAPQLGVGNRVMVERAPHDPSLCRIVALSRCV
jgi:translation initiation factor IF-1